MTHTQQIPCTFSTLYKSGTERYHTDFTGSYAGKEQFDELEAVVDLKLKTVRFSGLRGKNGPFERVFRVGDKAVYEHDYNGIFYGPIVSIGEKGVTVFKKSGFLNIPDKNTRLPLDKFIYHNWKINQAEADRHNYYKALTS